MANRTLTTAREHACKLHKKTPYFFGVSLPLVAVPCRIGHSGVAELVLMATFSLQLHLEAVDERTASKFKGTSNTRLC
jgi:hypothetical protein